MSSITDKPINKKVDIFGKEKYRNLVTDIANDID
jgi:hypothetical protein